MINDIYNYSLFLLSRRDYSVHKLKLKLKSKKYSDGDITNVISKLESLNYLKEDSYKETIIRKWAQKGCAEKLIKNKLRQEKLIEENDQIKTIQNDLGLNKKDTLDLLIRKKIKNNIHALSEDEKNKIKQKIIRFLISKGYDYSDIKEAIRDHFKCNDNA